MATKVVKTLKFPNSTDEYQINAVRLDGKTPDELIQTLSVANKSNTDTTDLVYAVTNIVESGTKGHTLTPTYTGLPTKNYVDTKVSDLAKALKFVGTTTTALTDGATTSPIKINNANYKPTKGDVVIVSGTDQEFVWTGSAWEELGNASSHSKVGHTHTVTHKPAGTVSTPTITVTTNTTTVNSITDVGSLPSLTYSEGKASKINSWSAGTLPSASLSGGTLTGSVSSGPNRVVTLGHTNPTLTFSAGTLPSLTYTDVDVDNITAWSAGKLPTKGSNTTVVTGIKSATATQPTFTGTSATLTTSGSNS